MANGLVDGVVSDEDIREERTINGKVRKKFNHFFRMSVKSGKSK